MQKMRLISALLYTHFLRLPNQRKQDFSINAFKRPIYDDILGKVLNWHNWRGIECDAKNASDFSIIVYAFFATF